MIDVVKNVTCRKTQILYREEECTVEQENTGQWTNAAMMLVHRLRRWPNITAAFANFLFFAAMADGGGGGEGVELAAWVPT